MFLPGCASIQPPAETISASTVAELQRSFDSSLKDINAALSAPQAARSDATVVRNFIETGMAMADIGCKAYFRNLGLAAQRYAFGRKELGLTGGLVAGLQGVTGVSAKAIAITSSMFSFGSASTESYADVFLFSPDISGIQDLVEGAQTTYRAAMPPVTAMSYGAAVGILRDYDKLCEVQTIRRLVNESVGTARFVASTTGEELLSAADRFAIARAIGEPTVTTEQVALIYWLVLGAPTPAEQALLAKNLQGLALFVGSDGKLKPLSPEDRDRIKRVLAPIVERGEAKLAALVASLRNAGAGGAGSGTEETPERNGGGLPSVPRTGPWPAAAFPSRSIVNGQRRGGSYVDASFRVRWRRLAPGLRRPSPRLCCSWAPWPRVRPTTTIA
ncbi:hypothetical protein [Massilia sp. Se16.2.3]|uniref:hypothetical protein n=1 Tax=Massilia sp. Se16.2.3 TaxID=2709303 RepID=UPI0015FFEF94|nr:hypothetical protein [Massilia sp. Se16.2.3]QNA99684.1 hypothetical protein G4G31_13945 [Massilia sp. Se16.2.3]